MSDGFGETRLILSVLDDPRQSPDIFTQRILRILVVLVDRTLEEGFVCGGSP